MLIDAAIRDREELVELGPADLGPLGARKGAGKDAPGTIGEPVRSAA